MFLDVSSERVGMAESPDVAALEALVPVPTVVDQQVAPELRGAGARRVAELTPNLLETFVSEKRICVYCVVTLRIKTGYFLDTSVVEGANGIAGKMSFERF